MLKRYWPILALGLSCASPKTAANGLPGQFTLVDEANQPESLDAVLAKSRYSVFLFYTSECPVQKAHDARMRDTIAKYAGKGVAFYAVDSEVGADMNAERTDAKTRAIGMPVLQDPNAAFADALGVEYSTHVVLMEPSRQIRYSGGEDSERVHITPGGTRYLERALDAVLAGKDPPESKAEALGCPLRKH